MAASLLLSAAGPAKVPDAAIADIRARERAGVVRLPRLRPGDAVRVTAGPFAGRPALVEGMAAGERVRVLLLWLGAPRLATLREASVEPTP